MRTVKAYSILLLMALSACGSGMQERSGNAPAPSLAKTEKSTDTVSAQTAVDLRSPSRKIIKTADFKCKVNNVFSAATSLENAVKSLGGMVQDSKIESNISDTRTIAYRQDSLKQIQTCKTTANIVLRVPVASLDSIVSLIPRLVTFIDYRVLKQQDYTLQFLSNGLKNEKAGLITEAVVAQQKSKNGKEALDLANYIDNKENEKINTRIENLQIEENVSYATLTVELYQPENVIITAIANTAFYTHPSFTDQVSNALWAAWELLQNIIAFLITILPLLFILLIGLLLYKKFGKKLISR